ncbi:sigma-54 dependent transcriptional regulator [Sedimentibacter sp.]|uniref:sigma-54-dependent transcriptional regulator n=1 Tax=Sedimentibacter sp. TaxID=1960295 RepID=UPI002897DC49|nr:sigma-54 dependent transcriptional regulator [Sedimentibacter sp.]
MKPYVLIIDDEPGICASLKLALKNDYNVLSYNNPYEALDLIEKQNFTVVLLDLKIGADNGLCILKKIKEVDPNAVVIMMTAYGSIGTSVEAMKNGAFNYLTKPLNIDELMIHIKQAVEFYKLNEQVSFLSEELRKKRFYDEIIGESEPMQHVYMLIDKLKNIDTNVLITGESGTGKEIVAKAIHESGKRSNERYIIVNCAAIPENLLELELFGCKKGAFTGAVSDHKGKFELADKGTIFLDEIGDMPIGLQSKLLRVLQSKEFTPLGSSNVRNTDVRIIAATNRNLMELIEAGDFRQDLYYRINVMEIKMPALRDRISDIPFLCSHFINLFSKNMNKSIKGLTKEATEVLLNYDFPGNVRQLANILEHAAIINSSGIIDVKDLPDEIVFRKLAKNKKTDYEREIDEYLAETSLKEIEKRAVGVTLDKNSGRRDQTAKDLGISKRGLLNKINEYGIK